MESTAERVKQKFPNLVTEASADRSGECVRAKREGIRDLLAGLKKDAEFDFNLLVDLFAVDYLHWEEKEIRFEVVYNLFSMSKNRRLFVKVAVPELDPEIDSAVALWPAADWYEREAWDMMGLVLKGHPNLKRILNMDEMNYFPMRKEYALEDGTRDDKDDKMFGR